LVSKLRALRIADRIREDLSELLLHQVHDPRLSGISITDVILDRELTYADIYVSALEGSQRTEEVLSGLNHANGYLRSQLAQNIELRGFPRLRFHWDSTFENAEHIDELLNTLRQEGNINGDRKEDG
jgi:ribosome-binding factor A